MAHRNQPSQMPRDESSLAVCNCLWYSSRIIKSFQSYIFLWNGVFSALSIVVSICLSAFVLLKLIVGIILGINVQCSNLELNTYHCC